jgi:hypothetical protein
MYHFMASPFPADSGNLLHLLATTLPFIGHPKEMETSMMRGIYLNPVPALQGAMIHMMWSAMYGVVFGLIWSRIGRTGPVPALAGAAYGAGIAGFMAWVVLPIVGAGSMPAMIGFSFFLEHILFGLALGLWPSAQPEVFTRPGALQATRAQTVRSTR